MPGYTVSTGNASSDSAYVLYSSGIQSSTPYATPPIVLAQSTTPQPYPQWTYGGPWQPNNPIFPGARCSAPPTMPGGIGNQIMLRNVGTPGVTRGAWDATEQACWTLICDGAALLTAVASIVFTSQTFDAFGSRGAGTVTWPDGATGNWARNGTRYAERTVGGMRAPGWDWKVTHRPPVSPFTGAYGYSIPLVVTVVQNQPDGSGNVPVPALVLCLDEAGVET